MKDADAEPKKKFDKVVVRDCIEEVLTNTLDGKVYAEHKAESGWITEITDQITERVRAMNFDRYKIIVTVTIGNSGNAEPPSSNTQCVWDSEMDAYTSFTFQNDSIFCLARVYGIYMY